MPGLKKSVAECSAKEIAEIYTLHQIGMSKRLRAYRALTLDPFEPTAVDYGLNIYGALPNTSPYEYCGNIVAIENGATNSPANVRGDFERMRRDKQFPLIDTPTYLSEGTEFLDESADYQQRLDKVLTAAGSLDRAFAGMVTLLGWSGRMLRHQELGDYQISDEIFYPERFTTTPFYDAWVGSMDLKGEMIETEMLGRLRHGDVALLFGWEEKQAMVSRDGAWRKYRTTGSSPAAESTVAKVLRDVPDCSLLPLAAAEEWLKFLLA